MKSVVCIFIMLLLVPGCKGLEKSVNPIKYLNVNQCVKFNGNKSVTLTQKYDMLFMPSNDVDRVFYLPFSNDVTRKYHVVKAFLIKKDELKMPLAVRFDESQRLDLDGNKYFLKRPRLLLPVTREGESIEVSFEMEIATSSAVMYIPDEPVENASITIIGNSEDLQVDAIGFERENSSIANTSKQTYLLDAKLGLVKSTSQIRSPRVIATTLKNWEMAASQMAATYQRELAKEINLDTLKPIIGEDILKMPSGDARVKLISNKLYDWLVNNFQFRSTYLDPRYSYDPRPIEHTWKNREGDCKDLSLIFIKLLSSFGIYAEPVLVVTTTHPFSPRFSAIPTLEIFDHVIVFIPSLNTYVDVTLGKESYLSMSNGLYDHTFGLHLREKSYRKLLTQNGNLRRVITHVRYDHGQWKANTQWFGQGQGQLDILSGFKYFDNNMKGTQNPKKFQQNDVTLIPFSWKLQSNQLDGTNSVVFEYLFNQSILGKHRNLIKFPFTYTNGVALEFNGHLNLNASVTGICFQNGISEEIIYIDDIEIKNFNSIKNNIRIDGISRVFTQKINFYKNKLTIVRTLETNEERLNCPIDEIEKNKEFFKNINALKDETIEQLIQQ